MNTNTRHAGHAHCDEAMDHLAKAMRAAVAHVLSPEAERELRAAARAGIKAAQAHLADLDRRMADAPAGPAAPAPAPATP